MPPQYPTYPQYPPQYPQNQGNFSHPPMPQLQQPPQPLQLQNPPRPTQIAAQPVANPNNRVVQSAYNTEIQPYLAYVISTLLVQEVQLRSGRIFPQQEKRKSTIVIEEEPEKEEMPSQNIEKGEEPIESNKINNSTPIILDSTTKSSQVKSGLGNTLQNPPYPERLAIEKPIMPESDLEV